MDWTNYLWFWICYDYTGSTANCRGDSACHCRTDGDIEGCADASCTADEFSVWCVGRSYAPSSSINCCRPGTHGPAWTDPTDRMVGLFAHRIPLRHRVAGGSADGSL